MSFAAAGTLLGIGSLGQGYGDAFKAQQDLQLRQKQFQADMERLRWQEWEQQQQLQMDRLRNQLDQQKWQYSTDPKRIQEEIDAEERQHKYRMEEMEASPISSAGGTYKGSELLGIIGSGGGQSNPNGISLTPNTQLDPADTGRPGSSFNSTSMNPMVKDLLGKPIDPTTINPNSYYNVYRYRNGSIEVSPATETPGQRTAEAKTDQAIQAFGAANPGAPDPLSGYLKQQGELQRAQLAQKQLQIRATQGNIQAKQLYMQLAQQRMDLAQNKPVNPYQAMNTLLRTREYVTAQLMKQNQLTNPNYKPSPSEIEQGVQALLGVDYQKLIVIASQASGGPGPGKSGASPGGSDSASQAADIIKQALGGH